MIDPRNAATENSHPKLHSVLGKELAWLVCLFWLLKGFALQNFLRKIFVWPKGKALENGNWHFPGMQGCW